MNTLFKIHIHLLLIIAFGFCSSHAFAQNRNIDSLKNIAWKLPADTGKVKTYMAISNRILSFNASESRIYADSALELSKKIQYKMGEGNSYVRLGLAFQALGKYDEALTYFNQGLEVFIRINDRVKQGKVYNNMGYSHMAKANYKQAIEYYLKALDISKRESDSAGMAAACTNIAIVFAVKSDYDQAEQYFNQAIAIYRRSKNDDMLYKNLLNLGGVYKDRGHYQKSIERIRMVQPYYEKKGIKSEIARCYYILASNYESMNDKKAAYENYTKALRIYEEIKNLPQITGCKLKLSGLLAESENYDRALISADSALNNALRLNAKALIIRSYKQLADIYSGKKDYKTAYDYRLKYEEMKDSVFNEENSSRINEIEAKYQNKIKENEIKELQASNTINELMLIRQRNVKYVLVWVSALILLICLLIYNQYNLKKKSNKILQNKNRIIELALNEKEVLLQEIHHRVKNNLQFVWSLLNLQARHVTDSQTLETLKEGRNRIKTMALIHQKLYQNNNLKGINMQEFIPNLSNSLFDTYSDKSTNITLETEIDPMVLDLDTALPLGLIINELITNAIKYAYDGIAEPVLKVQLKKNEHDLLLTVKDNGTGFPEGDGSKVESSFGIKLVNSLAKQLKAAVHISADNGICAEVRISKYQFA